MQRFLKGEEDSGVYQTDEREGLVERRKHERFQVKEGARAMVRPISLKTPRGRIVDISRQGLAFCYTVEQEPLDDSLELDICFAEYGFCLRRAPVRVISDFEIGTEDAPNFSPIKRRGVEFGQLTAQQMSQLEDFIENHTRGTAQVALTG
jgi:hypothetical protein